MNPDHLNTAHPYDPQCLCLRCTEHELSLRHRIAVEDERFMLDRARILLEEERHGHNHR